MPKKLSLFPMTRDLCATARYPSLLQGYNLSHLFVPEFMRVDGSDISRLDGGNAASMTLSHYSKDRLAECETIFIDYDEYLADLSFCKEVLADAKEMGKEVILSRTLEQKLREGPPSWPTDLPLEANPNTDLLREIKIPVIMVLSHGLRTDQFAFELALRQHFAEVGYTIGQIGSREMSHFFGFHGMPDFLYEHRDAYEKTLRFNRFIVNLVAAERPELLIIGVPDSIMKFNDRLLHGLGVLPSVICSGVTSDVSILCTYCHEYKEPFFDELSQHSNYRLGSSVQFFNLANTTVDVDDSNPDNMTFDFIDLDSNFVLQQVNNMNVERYHLFNALDRVSAKNACIAIQDALSGNVRYMQ
jgi:peptide maturation system protein (TIGR04066 family)